MRSPGVSAWVRTLGRPAAGLPARRPIPSRVSGQRCALRSQARSSGPARGGGGGGDGAAQSRPPPRRG